MIIHYCAPNDTNGNPRRCYVLFDIDNVAVAAWDEEYYGHHAVPGFWREQAYWSKRVECTPAKYRKLLKTLPSPNWAHDVPGYSHLLTVS